MNQWHVRDSSQTPICCEACSVLGLSVSVFTVPSKRTCSMQCAVCSIWSSQPQTRGRGGVQASALPTFIWCVCSPVWSVWCAGWWWMCVSWILLEPSFLEQWKVSSPSIVSVSVSFLPSSLILIHNVPYVLVHLMCTPLLYPWRLWSPCLRRVPTSTKKSGSNLLPTTLKTRFDDSFHDK